MRKKEVKEGPSDTILEGLDQRLLALETEEGGH